MASTDKGLALQQGAPAGANRKRRYPVAKIKGGWTPEEDEQLKRLVDEHAEGAWSVIARALNAHFKKPESQGRIGKQCRERWNHHLRPGIRHDAWTEEEEGLLVNAHIRYGNKWSDISRCIPGRTENAIKNHWNATLRRKELGKAPGVPITLKTYMQSINLLPSTAEDSDTDATRASQLRHTAARSGSSHHDAQCQQTTSTPRLRQDGARGLQAADTACTLDTLDVPLQQECELAALGGVQGVKRVRRLLAADQQDDPSSNSSMVEEEGKDGVSCPASLSSCSVSRDMLLTTAPRKRRSIRRMNFSAVHATHVVSHLQPTGTPAPSLQGPVQQSSGQAQATTSDRSDQAVLPAHHQPALHQYPAIVNCSLPPAVPLRAHSRDEHTYPAMHHQLNAYPQGLPIHPPIITAGMLQHAAHGTVPADGTVFAYGGQAGAGAGADQEPACAEEAASSGAEESDIQAAEIMLALQSVRELKTLSFGSQGGPAYVPPTLPLSVMHPFHLQHPPSLIH